MAATLQDAAIFLIGLTGIPHFHEISSFLVNPVIQALLTPARARVPFSLSAGLTGFTRIENRTFH